MTPQLCTALSPINPLQAKLCGIEVTGDLDRKS